MLRIAQGHALAGDGIYFDPEGDRAAPGEITNGFADTGLCDVDMRDENLDGVSVLPLMKGPPGQPPQAFLPSHKKGAALFLPLPHQKQQRVERKAFGVLASAPGGDPVGKKDVLGLLKKPSRGFAQEATAAAQVVLGKTARQDNRRSNPAAPASVRPASAAAVDAAPRAAPMALHHHRGQAAAEDVDDKENQPPPKTLPGVDAEDDRGRDGEAFENVETTIRRLREHAEKEREAAGPDGGGGGDGGGGLVWPMPLEVAKSMAIPGVRFRQGVLGELSVVDLYSTGERVSVPSKGLIPFPAGGVVGGGGGGSAVPHMMTERGRAEVKAYLSEAGASALRDPGACGGDNREDATENQLVDMFLSLHFDDGWLEGDTVITRPPRSTGPHPFVEGNRHHQHNHAAQDTGDSHARRPAKRYCVGSPDLEAGANAAGAAPSLERAQQQQPTMGPPPVPIRCDLAAASASATCGSRPIPIRHNGPGESDFLKFREPPPLPVEARSFVSESEGDDDPCRSFESVSTQPRTYGTSGAEQQLGALDGLRIGRPFSSVGGGKREPASAAAGLGALRFLRGDHGKED